MNLAIPNHRKIVKGHICNRKLSFCLADPVVRYSRSFCLQQVGGTFLHHYYDLPPLKYKHSSFRNVFIFFTMCAGVTISYYHQIKVDIYKLLLFHNGFCLAK